MSVAVAGHPISAMSVAVAGHPVQGLAVAARSSARPVAHHAEPGVARLEIARCRPTALKEPGARSKEQGARSKEQGAGSEEHHIRGHAASLAPSDEPWSLREGRWK
ncbi:hypothetical protein PMIN03_005523 [Paraphaeosphaeria minitans]|uniref:Uncharacterized protein n=1 Tax=Paraphaeosphaeria minitans TaxID=565426 RepID=A0A9P6KPC6_9PLEO|nr:hypothetical protein PMIN01_09147 [Paraphaeosphaeria minitans]